MMETVIAVLTRRNHHDQPNMMTEAMSASRSACRERSVESCMSKLFWRRRAKRLAKAMFEKRPSAEFTSVRTR
jgi:hypothetical protein